MADTSRAFSPPLPDYLPVEQRAIYRPGNNTYIPPGFGFRSLSQTGNVPATTTPAAPPSTPAGLRGVYAVRSVTGSGQRGDPYDGVPTSGNVTYDPNVVDFEPGQFSVGGFSYGTAVGNDGYVYDAVIFDPVGALGAAGGVVVPGLGVAAGLAGRELRTGGVVTTTNRRGRVDDLYANPGGLKENELALIERNARGNRPDEKPLDGPGGGQTSGGLNNIRAGDPQQSGQQQPATARPGSVFSPSERGDPNSPYYGFEPVTPEPAGSPAANARQAELEIYSSAPAPEAGPVTNIGSSPGGGFSETSGNEVHGASFPGSSPVERETPGTPQASIRDAQKSAYSGGAR